MKELIGWMTVRRLCQVIFSHVLQQELTAVSVYFWAFILRREVKYMCGLLFLLFRNTVVMSGDRRVVTGGRKQNGTEAGRNRRRIDRMLMQTHTHTQIACSADRSEAFCTSSPGSQSLQVSGTYCASLYTVLCANAHPASLLTIFRSMDHFEKSIH